METTELFSVNVAAPVVAVVFCAFLVFLFGFKAPVQPPSFDFEDERKQTQRKAKKVKVGHSKKDIRTCDSLSSETRLLYRRCCLGDL